MAHDTPDYRSEAARQAFFRRPQHEQKEEIAAAQAEAPEIERTIESPESKQLRRDIDRLLEQRMISDWDAEVPPHPTEDRQLKPIVDDEGRVLAQIDEVRNPREAKTRHNSPRKVGVEDLWLVVDFDDVVNRTTEFNTDLRTRLGELGVPPDVFDRLYHDMHITNAQGKSVYRHDQFVAALKSAYPDRSSAIDGIFAGVDYPSYIDQGVKRAIESTRDFHWKTVRVSILTHGDLDYQKGRVDASGIDAVVDDIIYTESSKRETLEALTKTQYGKSTENPYGSRPTIVVFDDSPEQVQDFTAYDDERNFVNVRYHSPRARRYHSPTNAEGVVTAEEESPNLAALRLYEIASILTIQHDFRSRADLFRRLRNPDDYKKIISYHLPVSYLNNSWYRRDGQKVLAEYDWTDELTERSGHRVHPVAEYDDAGQLQLVIKRPNYQEFILNAE